MQGLVHYDRSAMFDVLPHNMPSLPANGEQRVANKTLKEKQNIAEDVDHQLSMTNCKYRTMIGVYCLRKIEDSHKTVHSETGI